MQCGAGQKWLAMARSGLHDARVIAVFNAIKACEQPEPPVVDWIQFYTTGGLNSIGSYVGPIAVCQFHGRGLGLVATRRINAGDLLLVEDSFALSRTRNAPIAQSTSELVDACSKKIESSATLLHKIVFWCLHSQSDNKSCSYKDADVRKRVFDHYLGQLNSKAMDTEFLSSISQPCLEKQDTIVASIISSNSRKTEHWNPWTLLLDESESLAGLWLAASLFNHSCLGNVVITYGARKDCQFFSLIDFDGFMLYWVLTKP